MINSNPPTRNLFDLWTKKNLKETVNNIKIEAQLLKLESNENLIQKASLLKKKANREGLEKVLVEWFALTQEVSERTIGLRHFDTQLMAGILLHEGNVVEMKTGEGKTLASTLPVSLNALSGLGVHVVTVNEYLADRDQKMMAKLYKGLGLVTGLVSSEETTKNNRAAYTADITYVTNSQVVFDYLRDSTATDLNDVLMRPFNYCIIDEIDSVLIDEARTPLIISQQIGESNIPKLLKVQKIISKLQQDLDFKVNEKERDVELTNEGSEKICKLLGKENLYDTDDGYMLEVLNALKANYVFKKDKDYIVLDNKVMIVDSSTGRVMSDRRWSLGLHEAVETKAGVPVGKESETKTLTTYQNFFTLYPKLSGMSGTVITVGKEFEEIYKLKTREVPTAKPMIRDDLQDKVFATETGKWKGVVERIKKCHEQGQPILIGTANVDKSELLSELLLKEGIEHEVLNARPENVKRESQIIAFAGKKGAVTIATNMAGRGTDIILGGNPVFKVREKLSNLFEIAEGEKQTNNQTDDSLARTNSYREIKEIIKEYEEKKKLKTLKIDLKTLPYSRDTCLIDLKNLYDKEFEVEKPIWKKENTEVRNLGGLFVLGTERAESRRIDDQLRGRSGRQGDPGVSEFYVSLDDQLMKVFGNTQMLKGFLNSGTTIDESLNSPLLTNALQQAQQKVEDFFFEGRKSVFQYDEVLNEQRKKFYKLRQEILNGPRYLEEGIYVTESFTDNFFSKNSKTMRSKNQKIDQMKKYYEFENWTGSYASKIILETEDGTELKSIGIGLTIYNEIWISTDLRYGATSIYDYEYVKEGKTSNVLEIMDTAWKEHLERMSFIRDTIQWRSFGQLNPLLEYNSEAINSYEQFCKKIQFCMIYYFLTDSIIKV